MKKFIVSIAASLLVFAAIAQTNKIAIIPQPVELRQGVGNFTISASTTISLLKEDMGSRKAADALNTELQQAAGYKLPVYAGSLLSKNVIQLQILQNPDAQLGDEGYRLNAGVDIIRISANKAAGLFYGGQTLLQLLGPIRSQYR